MGEKPGGSSTNEKFIMNARSREDFCPKQAFQFQPREFVSRNLQFGNIQNIRYIEIFGISSSRNVQNII